MLAPEAEDWEAQVHATASSSEKKSLQGEHGSVHSSPFKAHRQKTILTVDMEEVVWWYTPRTAVLRRQRMRQRAGYKFKSILGYLASFRPV